MLLEKYIFNQLFVSFLFSICICSILGELIGISFEQVRFIVNRGLSWEIAAYIHYLKLPSFVVVAIPFAILMACIFTYGNLTKNNEIIALRSFGISPFKIIKPALFLSVFLAVIMFIINDFIVPPFNYQAAIILEQEMNVDRNILAKYNKNNIIYQEFIEGTETQELKRLIFADKFENNHLKNVIILNFKGRKLTEIIITNIAQFNPLKNTWILFNGHKNTINFNGKYDNFQRFKELEVQLPKTLLKYVQNNYDYREMTIFQLFDYLPVIEKTYDTKKIRQLKITIQERFAIPFSCVIFAFIGATLGLKLTPKSSNNTLGITIIIIFAYYLIRFLTISFSTVGIIPLIFGVWFPNFLGLKIGYVLFHQLK